MAHQKVVVYHNPRCSKSRNTVALLREKGIEPQIIEYLKDVLDSKEISSLCSKLNLTPGQLIRTGEVIYKENYSQKQLSDSESIEAMVAHPILIERPIVVCNSKAAIGRPPENVLTIL